MAHMVVIIRSHLGIGMWALGQVHQLAGAQGVSRRQGFCRSIVPERGSQLPFQGQECPFLLPKHKWETQRWRAAECCNQFDLSDVCVCFFLLSDVRPGYCYTALANGRCSNQLPQSITKMQCCCDIGRCWSPGITLAPEMCPIRATGKSPPSLLQSVPTRPPQAWWQCA